MGWVSGAHRNKKGWPYDHDNAIGKQVGFRISHRPRVASIFVSKASKRKMRTLTLAAVLALLAVPAVVQHQTFRNERGQITGSSSTSGNVTTFRDRSGRMTGTAERMRDGSVQYRDAGRLTRLGDG